MGGKKVGVGVLDVTDPTVGDVRGLLDAADDLDVTTVTPGDLEGTTDCFVVPTGSSDDALAAFARVRATHPELPVVLAVGEDGPAMEPGGDRAPTAIVRLDGSDGDGLVDAVRGVVRDPDTYHEQFQAIVEHAPAMIAVLDRDGRYRYLSPSVERVLGFDADDLLGEVAFDRVHDEDREAVEAEFDAALEDPTHRASAEYRYRDADAEWRVLRSWGTNRLADPEVRGFVVTTLDVTERREHELALERQNERLEEFASVVSHDLRNPLNILQGQVDLARAGTDLDLDEVERATDRMESIIDGLLSLARQGRALGETEAVAVADLARQAWGTVDTGDATLAVADPPVDVQADPGRLQELFENLFRNAVQHGGPDVTVTVGGLADGFYVADDGPGVPAADREQVFERGFTTVDDGTGFGLTIVQTIAEAHGWTVDLAASAAGGARFEIRDVRERPPTTE